MIENRSYIITERAHFMCPNMHFGIKAVLTAAYDLEKVKVILEKLAQAHPFLKSRIARGDTAGSLIYEYAADQQIPLIEKADNRLWMKDYQALTKKGWDVFQESLLKVLVYPRPQGFEVLFAAHHLLADGRGLLGLVCEFADCYATGASPLYAKEQLIRSLRDLPPGSDLSLPNRLLLRKFNRAWRRENHRVTHSEYHAFEQQFLAENPVTYSVEALDRESVDELRCLCRKQRLSINDYLVAEMMRQEQTRRVVIAMDIRGKLSCYQKGALGNYATATGIEVRPTPGGMLELAAQAARQIRRNTANTRKAMTILACYLHLEPELIDAAAISVLGDFPSRAGRFIGTVILGYEKRDGYGLTNLGNVENPHIEEALFLPPASPANRKTVGVLSVNRRMQKCTVSYEDRR